MQVEENLPPEKRIYQAIGLIYGTLQMPSAGKFTVEWQGKEWPLKLTSDVGKVKAQISKEQYWRVYTQVDRSENKHLVSSFIGVRYFEKAPTCWQDGAFELSGCWHTIPHWRTESEVRSYFTVYRNRRGYKLDWTCYTNYSLVWEESPFIVESDTEAPWHSIQTRLHSDGHFEFEKLLEGPHPCPPRAGMPVPRPKLRPPISEPSLVIQ